MARMLRRPDSDKENPVPQSSVPRRLLPIVWDYAKSLIVAILVALAVRAFVVQAFVIPSGSMLPTLRISDYVLVSKFWYWFRPIERGDILVFEYPRDESKDFIKRVIGLPGDTLVYVPRALHRGTSILDPLGPHRGAGRVRCRFGSPADRG